MFRASDIHGAPAGPRGPALAASKAAPTVVPPPPWAIGKGAAPPVTPAPPVPAPGGKSWGKGPSWEAPKGGYGPELTPPIFPVPQPYGKGMPMAKGKVWSAPPSRPSGSPNTVTLLGAGSLPAGIEKDIQQQTKHACDVKGLTSD
eukprot:g28687.t1